MIQKTEHTTVRTDRPPRPAPSVILGAKTGDVRETKAATLESKMATRPSAESETSCEAEALHAFSLLFGGA